MLEGPILRGAFWQLERYVILKRTLSIGNFLCLSGPRRRFSLLMKKNLCLMPRFYNIKMDLWTYLQKAEDIMDFLIVIGAMDL